MTPSLAFVPSSPAVGVKAGQGNGKPPTGEQAAFASLLPAEQRDGAASGRTQATASATADAGEGAGRAAVDAAGAFTALMDAVVSAKDSAMDKDATGSDDLVVASGKDDAEDASAAVLALAVAAALPAAGTLPASLAPAQAGEPAGGAGQPSPPVQGLGVPSSGAAAGPGTAPAAASFVAATGARSEPDPSGIAADAERPGGAAPQRPATPDPMSASTATPNTPSTLTASASAPAASASPRGGTTARSVVSVAAHAAGPTPVPATVAAGEGAGRQPGSNGDAGGRKSGGPEPARTAEAVAAAAPAGEPVAPDATRQVLQGMATLGFADPDATDAASQASAPTSTAAGGQAAPAARVTPGTVTIELNPATLGRVTVTVRLRGDSLDVRIAADRADTQALLNRDRHQIEAAVLPVGGRVELGSGSQRAGEPPSTPASGSDGAAAGAADGRGGSAGRNDRRPSTAWEQHGTGHSSAPSSPDRRDGSLYV